MTGPSGFDHDEWPPIEADTLPGLLKLRAEQLANKVCMRRKHLGIWEKSTWKEVYENVRAFGLGLMKMGLRRGETIAIVGENRRELFWSEHAALAVGAKVVCLYPDMIPSEIQYIVENSESVYYVAEDQEQVDKILEIKDQIPDVRKVIYWSPKGMWHYDDPSLLEFKEVQEEGRRYGRENPDLFEKSIRQGKGTDIAVLSYTSGTTGLPKGVIMTHANLLDMAYRTTIHDTLRPFTQYLSYISPAWSIEQHFGMTLALLVPFVLNFPEEPETVQSNIRELGAEALVLGPRQWENLASMVQSYMLDAGPIRQFLYNLGMKIGEKVASHRIERVRINPIWYLLYPMANRFILRAILDNIGFKKTYMAIAGGTAMAPDVFRFFNTIGLKLRNAYGATEVGLLTQHRGDSFNLDTMGTWFRSHPDFGPPLEWKLADKGELLVRGASGFAGYYKNPEATAEKFVDEWFCTGDAVRIEEDGSLIFLDRVSDLRTLATGHFFPPQFIETKLRFSPYIKDVIVIGDETRPFVSALINIDGEIVGQWAEKNRLVYMTFPDLTQMHEVCGLIRREIERVNSVLEEQSRVMKFVNLPKELDPDEAELTRSRKLRRDYLEDRYGDLIKAIYGSQKEFTTEVSVKYRDGRTGIVKTITNINSFYD
ncbi:MAG: AMP-binding protein [Thermodesulfobacteriota bacterium]|nr:AMP-binding protein [Thermodesulfobacteriota bacterium]